MFNALRYTKELEEAGFSREQAEISIQILIDVMNDNFATKSDLKELELALKSDFKELELAMKSDFKELRSEMQANLTQIRSEMQTDFTQVRTEMQANLTQIRSEMRELDYKLTIKLGTMMTVAIGVTATLVKLL